MYKSVSINKGFYIGRYEAGKDETGDAIVKKNATVYDQIMWGNSMTDHTGGAVELARNFAKKQGHNTEKIHTTLCYSVQWDAALQFIDPSWNDYIKDSAGKGNYKASQPIPAGSNEDYRVKNIYDMAGNVWEWTMETGETDSRTYRGAGYTDSGSSRPSSCRIYGFPNMSDALLGQGFRIALYV